MIPDLCELCVLCGERMRSIVAALALLGLLSVTTAVAAQQPQILEAETMQQIRLPYLLFLPANYEEDQQRRWPFILYLHGGSARGNDLERLREMGLPKRLAQDAQFPFIVASPLLPEGEIWTDVHALGALIDKVTREHRLDPARIYVTGHSMGGRGALYLAYKQPERFAAVAALSPYSPITAWSKGLTNVPLWLIHGAKDVQAPIKDTEEIVRGIEKAGGHARFTPLPDADHFILNWYDRNEIFHWLLDHRKDARETNERAR